MKTKNIELLFKGSLLLLFFMCGIMTGRSVEEKEIRQEMMTVTEIEIQEKNLLVSWLEGIEVYFDSWEDGRVNLIVNNHRGNKLQEVSIVNMEIDGNKINTYSDLEGIRSGEIKRCTICYDNETMNGQVNTPSQIKGELYVRGSMDYIYQKIVINI